MQLDLNGLDGVQLGSYGFTYRGESHLKNFESSLCSTSQFIPCIGDMYAHGLRTDAAASHTWSEHQIIERERSAKAFRGASNASTDSNQKIQHVESKGVMSAVLKRGSSRNSPKKYKVRGTCETSKAPMTHFDRVGLKRFQNSQKKHKNGLTVRLKNPRRENRQHGDMKYQLEEAGVS